MESILQSLKLIEFEELSSSNDYLKKNYEKYDSNTVVLVAHQTAGRGRRGRVWLDYQGSLMFSILLKEINFSTELASFLMAAAVVKTTLPFVDDVKVKWPNDIFLNGKKFCGILSEVIYDNQEKNLIIGTGLNILSLEGTFLDTEYDITSLYDESECRLSKKDFLREVLKNFKELEKMNFMSIVQKHSFLDGKTVWHNDKQMKVIRILDNGHLVLQYDGKEYFKICGEVEVYDSKKNCNN